jgi:hypothetical protein
MLLATAGTQAAEGISEIAGTLFNRSDANNIRGTIEKAGTPAAYESQKN